MRLIGVWLLGGFLLLVGAALAAGGAWLLTLGGSPYYLLAGAGCIASGVLLFRRRVAGLWVYLAVLASTVAWAFWEVGPDFWQLLPRIGGPLAIGLCCALPWIWRPLGPERLPHAAVPASRAKLATAAMLAAALAGGWLLLAPRPGIATAPVSTPASGQPDDWTAFGRTAGGSRFAPAAQITPANVDRLAVAWTYRTGDVAAAYPNSKAMFAFQATPLKIADTLYFCTPHDIVVALDATTGRERWRFDPKVNSRAVVMLVCRGVSYHQAANPVGDCPKRILVSTVDGRMIALDADSGRRCAGFGRDGEISLRDGLGHVEDGIQYVTSPATIVGDAAVVGGFVLDGVTVGEPSGVVRAFDVTTGKLLWAWDIGRTGGALKPGEFYTRGTPNAWSVFSADPKLGLVYVPTGNATPDFYGAGRTAAMDRFASSVVALDAATGAVRWSFQTVHHDVWDYDVGSQPVLIDLPGPGGPVPALIQPTKHGEIYLLDRSSGAPLAQVQERPAPKGDIPGEHYSASQPWSAGMPSFTPPPLTEAAMWGATPLDQLWCRIKFRQMDYRGKFTPPATHPTLQYPGNFGVIDWGSVSVDEKRGLMLVNTSRLPLRVRLLPRVEADKLPNYDAVTGHMGLTPQKGTPYAVDFSPFFSPLGLPCNAPPWGQLAAVDLKTRKLAWQVPLGTTRDHAPLHIAVPGVFNLGGSVATGGGVTFIGATIDNYLRAFDTENGRELWKGRLPAGGQAAPMSYIGADGRQYVVIAAGGHGFMRTTPGDSLVAYALPGRPNP